MLKSMLSMPLFCFLLALNIPLSYFADNQSLYPFSDVIRTLVLFQICTLILYFLGKIVFRRNLYAISIASTPLIFFWFLGISVTVAYIAAACSLVALLVLGYLFEHRKLILILNVVICSALVQPLYKIVSQTTLQSFIGANYGLLKNKDPALDIDNPGFKYQRPPPSIVHITLDAYASDAVLSEVMGFDNSEFSAALKSKGFTVFERAVAPYNQTLFSMASIFSGEYLDLELLAPESKLHRHFVLVPLLVAGLVRETLNILDYDFAYNEGIFKSHYPKNAILNQTIEPSADSHISTFEYVFLRLRANQVYSDLAQRFPGYFESASSRKNAEPVKPSEKKSSKKARKFQPATAAGITTAFDQEFLKKLEPPFFYAIHLLAPHPPFTTDRNGNYTTAWRDHFGTIAAGSDAHKMQADLQKQYALGYTEKLLFTNAKVLEYVEYLLAHVSYPLIIVIHGDHGSGVLLDTSSPATTCLRERFSPYLAVYANSPELSARLEQHASERFNLTNLYRLVFDEIFEEDIALVDSKSTFVSYDDIGEFTEVEDRDLDRLCDLPWESAHK